MERSKSDYIHSKAYKLESLHGYEGGLRSLGERDEGPEDPGSIPSDQLFHELNFDVNDYRRLASAHQFIQSTPEGRSVHAPRLAFDKISHTSQGFIFQLLKEELFDKTYPSPEDIYLAREKAYLIIDKRIRKIRIRKPKEQK